MASRRNGTIYTGVTTNLVQRVWQHKHNVFGGFTNRHQVRLLVYYETYTSIKEAIVREKQLKDWHRAWKLELIEKDNPEWRDLWAEICREESSVTD